MSNGHIRGFGLLHAVALAAIAHSRRSHPATWRASRALPRPPAPWVAVAVADGDVAHGPDIAGGEPR